MLFSSQADSTESTHSAAKPDTSSTYIKRKIETEKNKIVVCIEHERLMLRSVPLPMVWLDFHYACVELVHVLMPIFVFLSTYLLSTPSAADAGILAFRIHFGHKILESILEHTKYHIPS